MVIRAGYRKETAVLVAVEGVLCYPTNSCNTNVNAQSDDEKDGCRVLDKCIKFINEASEEASGATLMSG